MQKRLNDILGNMLNEGDTIMYPKGSKLRMGSIKALGKVNAVYTMTDGLRWARDVLKLDEQASVSDEHQTKDDPHHIPS